MEHVGRRGSGYMIVGIVLLWFIGGAFTVGFINDEADSFLEFLMWMIFWPIFLGLEIRKALDK